MREKCENYDLELCFKLRYTTRYCGFERKRQVKVRRYRAILSNYRNEVIKSFAEKIRENRGKKEFLVVKSVEKRSIAVTFGVGESKQE